MGRPCEKDSLVIYSQSDTNNVRKKIDVKQLDDSPEKEEHKKKTISINVQKHSKTAWAEWQVRKQFYAIRPPG